MKAYLDTSVIVALVTREPSYSAVEEWIARNAQELHASDFALGEFVSAVGLKVRLARWNEAQALHSIAAAERWVGGPAVALTTSADIGAATAYVARFELALRLPDAIHIAIAKRLGATLVSLDKRQLDGARSLGIAAADPLA